MNDKLKIIQLSNNNLVTIQEISEEEIWLQNFTSEATKNTYKTTVKKFCKMFEINHIEQLRSVTSVHIIRFRDAMREAGEKNSSINSRLAGLSSLFKHLIEKQIVKANPVYGVKPMKNNYKNVNSRLLLNHEVSALLNQPDREKLIGLRDAAILSIFFNLGVRRGSIRNLRGKDIYELNGYMIFELKLKGDKRVKLAVNSHIQANIKNYFMAIGYATKDEKGNIAINIPDEVPVFPRMDRKNFKIKDFTKPISGTSIWRLWKKYASQANIEKSRPHCARSTFITVGLEVTKDPARIQGTVGHSDLGTTMKYNQKRMKEQDSASFAVSFG